MCCLCQPGPAPYRPSSICLRFPPCGRKGVDTRVLIYLCVGIYLPRDEAVVKGKGREEGWEGKAQKRSCGGPKIGRRNVSIIATLFQPHSSSWAPLGWKVCVLLGMGVCNLNYALKHLASFILKLSAEKKKKMWFPLQCHWGTYTGFGIIKMKTLMSKPWHFVSKTYVLPPPLALYFILRQA